MSHLNSFGAPKFSAHTKGAPVLKREDSFDDEARSPGYAVFKIISHFCVDVASLSIYAQNSMDARTFLKSSEVARTLGISRRTLALWVKEGRIPEPQKSPAGYFLWADADLLNVRGLTKRSPGPQRGSTTRRRNRAA